MALVAATGIAPAAAVPYDIVYVRQPRFGDTTNTTWPEVAHPAQHRPRRRPDAAAPRRQRGAAGRTAASARSPIRSSPSTPSGSTTATSTTCAPQALQLAARSARTSAPTSSASTCRRARSSSSPSASSRPTPAPATSTRSNPVDPGRAATTASATASSTSAPAPLAGGKIAFTSNRNGFVPPRGLTNPTLQLFVMDEDGAQRHADRADEHRQRAAPDAAARRPPHVQLARDRRACATRRMWGIWSIWPDGRHWEPVVSAFRERPGVPLHDPALERRPRRRRLLQPQQQRLRRALSPAGARRRPARRRFYSAFPDENPSIDQTVGGGFHYPFTHAVHAVGHVLDHAVHARQRRGGADRRRRRARRQVHASERRAEQRPARRVDARPGQRPRPADHRSRATTPAST